MSQSSTLACSQQVRQMNSCSDRLEFQFYIGNWKKNHAFIIGQKLLLEDLSDFRKIGPLWFVKMVVQ